MNLAGSIPTHKPHQCSIASQTCTPSSRKNTKTKRMSWTRNSQPSLVLRCNTTHGQVFAAGNYQVFSPVTAAAFIVRVTRRVSVWPHVCCKCMHHHIDAVHETNAHSSQFTHDAEMPSQYLESHCQCATQYSLLATVVPVPVQSKPRSSW